MRAPIRTRWSTKALPTTRQARASTRRLLARMRPGRRCHRRDNGEPSPQDAVAVCATTTRRSNQHDYPHAWSAGPTAGAAAARPRSSSPMVSPIPRRSRCTPAHREPGCRRGFALHRDAGDAQRHPARWQRPPLRRHLHAAPRGGRWRDRRTACVAHRIGDAARKQSIEPATGFVDRLPGCCRHVGGLRARIIHATTVVDPQRRPTVHLSADPPDAAIPSRSPGADAMPADAAVPADRAAARPVFRRHHEPDGCDDASATAMSAWRMFLGRRRNLPRDPVFPDDPSRRAYLYFQDAQTPRPESGSGVGPGFPLASSDNGIGIGTPLSRLVRDERQADPFQRPRLGLRRRHHRLERRPVGAAATRSDTAASSAWPTATLRPIAIRWATWFSPATIRVTRTWATVVSVGEIGVSFPGEDDL